MWDETSPYRQNRRRNGSSRARYEACFQDVPLGEVQDEYDHDNGHGTYRCCGSRNGEVDGIRHSPEILLRSDTISPDHPLLAAWKIHLRLSAASPCTRSLDSLPTNNSCILLLRLDLPLLKRQGSSTKNTEHVSSHRSGHNGGLQLQRSPHHSAKRRFLLRGRLPPRHFRPIWPLDGDEISARHNRRLAGIAPTGSASSQSSPRWERESHLNFTSPSRRHHNSETRRPSAC